MPSPKRWMWPIIYVALACVPLAVALVPPRPPGRSFWLELSVALGFIGLAQMALELSLIARFQRISRPFGIDLVMQYHRQIGLVAVGLVLAHPLALAFEHPAYLAMLNPFAGPAAGRTGALSLLALLLLVALTLGRRLLRLSYEAWRFTHALLGVGALVLAYLHVVFAGLYATSGWKLGALGAYCGLFVALLFHLRLLRPFGFRRRPWEVMEVRPEPARTWELTLAPVGHSGLSFAPGQFAWVKLGVSAWSLREHPFSFSSSAEQPRQVRFGIKELGDFTDTIGEIQPGTRAYLDGPHGSFSPDFEAAPGYVFIAGGIGISPMLSMLRTLADRHDRRPHALVYACSAWDRIAFRDEIEALAARLSLEVVNVLERPPEGWQGETGYVSADLLGRLLREGEEGRHIFLCGPDAMLTAVERALLGLGVEEGRIHMERFDLA
jgi:predicted ferric reductase